jgi:hypothetical protein
MGRLLTHSTRVIQPPGFAQPANIPGMIGLVQCSGQAVDLVSGKRISIGSAATLSAQPQGLARNASGTTAAIYTARRAWPVWESTGPLTLVAYFMLDSASGFGSTLIGQAGGATGYGIYNQYGTNRGYHINGALPFSTGAAWPLGVPISAALTYDGTNLEGWFNGVSDGIGASTAPTYGTFSSLAAGGTPDAGTSMNGRTWYFALFNRVLAKPEIVRLAEFPFSIYADDTNSSWYPYVAAAAGGFFSRYYYDLGNANSV